MPVPDLSIVLPIFDERDALEGLIAEINRALSGRRFEIVAVDDGSRDGSFQRLLELRPRYPMLRIVKLRRNSGQSAALTAGFQQARAPVIVTLDADGQNDPADIDKLVERLDSGAPCVAAVVGWRRQRSDSTWKRIQSRVANAARNVLTGDRVRDTGCGLKAFRREALTGLPEFDGVHRFLPTLIRLWRGHVIEIPVSHRARRHGRTKYGMWNRIFRGCRDAIGVRWLIRRRLRYEIDDVVE